MASSRLSRTRPTAAWMSLKRRLKPISAWTSLLSRPWSRIRRHRAATSSSSVTRRSEQDAPHGGLDVVKAQVEADLRVDVLVEPAVVADPPAPRRHVVVVGDEEIGAGRAPRRPGCR